MPFAFPSMERFLFGFQGSSAESPQGAGGATPPDFTHEFPRRAKFKGTTRLGCLLIAGAEEMLAHIPAAELRWRAIPCRDQSM
jgi:hypothetical protein